MLDDQQSPTYAAFDTASPDLPCHYGKALFHHHADSHSPQQTAESGGEASCELTHAAVLHGLPFTAPLTAQKLLAGRLIGASDTGSLME